MIYPHLFTIYGIVVLWSVVGALSFYSLEDLRSTTFLVFRLLVGGPFIWVFFTLAGFLELLKYLDKKLKDKGY